MVVLDGDTFASAEIFVVKSSNTDKTLTAWASSVHSSSD